MAHGAALTTNRTGAWARTGSNIARPRRGAMLRSLGAMLLCAMTFCSAPPTIEVSDIVSLDVVAADAVALRNVDMLAFDAFGNLLANREVRGSAGGVTYIDVANGTATVLLTGISRADGITLHPSGAIYITSEVSGASTSDRIFRVDLTYDANQVPVSAAATSITTSLAIDNPEGIVALHIDNEYGSAGALFVCEDRSPGRVFRLVPDDTDMAIASVLVDLAADLTRPEGIALGDFGGGLNAARLFVAETNGGNVLQIAPDGSVGVVGDPAAVSMVKPDNVAFGFDGRLYVSEDVGSGAGRIIRIDADGTHEVALSGFNLPQGLAFDSTTNDLYIAEQGADRVWRARFRTTAKARRSRRNDR